VADGSLVVSPLARCAASFLELLAPSRCAACDEVSRAPLCDACGPRERAEPATFDGVPVVAAGRYSPPLSHAIRRLKFEGRPELARPLATLLLAELGALSFAPDDAWVPVPLHRARLVERGFNQAALLARALADGTGGVYAPRTLERRRATEQQARLGRAERRDNALGAFVLRRPVAGGRVVLVDDVVTTGATARACLEALREGGADVLAIVALARASGRSC
jgi:ComF family protein